MVTKALIDFIKDERASGVSHDIVAKKLKEKGWHDRDIEEGFRYAEHPDVPVPPSSIYGTWSDLVLVSWNVYRSKWKRFASVGGVFIGLVVIATIFLLLLNLPRIIDVSLAIHSGDNEAIWDAITSAIPLIVAVFVLIQVWFMSTVYAVALKTGDSVWERWRAGWSHVWKVLMIKIMSITLVLLTFIPTLVVAMFTNNPFVFFTLLPLSLVAAVLVSLHASLAVPAYFHGVDWKNAILTSIRTLKGNLFAYVVNMFLFGLGIILVSLVFQNLGPLSILLSVMFITPVQALFMLALYRSLPEPKASVSIARARPVIHMVPEIEVKEIVKEEKAPTKSVKSTKK